MRNKNSYEKKRHQHEYRETFGKKIHLRSCLGKNTHGYVYQKQGTHYWKSNNQGILKKQRQRLHHEFCKKITVMNYCKGIEGFKVDDPPKIAGRYTQEV